MAEIQPQLQETRINGGAPLPAVPSTATAAAAATENISSKRQRRPSVRLGEIGDQPAATVSFESHRRAKQWKATSKDKASKTRNLTNLGGGGETLEVGDERERERELNLDKLAIGSWRTKDPKSNKRLKRPRTNWLAKTDGGGGNNIIDNEGVHNDGDRSDKYGGEGTGEDGFSRDFEVEDSESPLREQHQQHSPVNDSLDNLEEDGEGGHGIGNEREMQFGGPHGHNLRGGGGGTRKTVEGSSRDHHHQHGNRHHELDGDGPSDTDRNVGHSGRGGGWRKEEEEEEEADGVSIWLNGLGLGRYWPVFQIHEVDEEVLPMLTLEDLKDMGINAVGSRRKIFSAIQKLGHGHGQGNF
ncbi:hypothetical protein Dimus_006855 [Dionaea muscipula]